MNDAGYIATGFVVTFVTVAGYLVSLQTRLRRAVRVNSAYDVAREGHRR